ncbi:MAG: LPS export ABC transporter permease LptF [Gammaproteobacteria bacterium]|nr:LPS export ABC transporter permease LptF [Gammaproteobacteria bacterium]
MIIERYLLKEMGYTLIGVTLLLLLIFMSGSLVTVLTKAVEGEYSADLLLQLFALKSISNLSGILPLSAFFAVLLAFGRLYQDSEMSAMLTCGIGPKRIFKSVTLIAILVGGLVSVLSLYLTPWAENYEQRLIDVSSTNSSLEGMTAGRFVELGGKHLFYVETIDEDKQKFNNVFYHNRVGKQLSLLSAESAHEYRDDKTASRYLVLNSGYRYEGVAGQPDYKVVKFESHGLRLVTQEVKSSQRDQDALPTSALWGTGKASDIAELQWRISLPLMTVLLLFVGVVLSKTSPRQGRYGRFFIGILIYFVYYNLMLTTRSWLASDKIAPELGMWWVHGIVLMLIIITLVRQNKLPAPKQKIEAPSS